MRMQHLFATAVGLVALMLAAPAVADAPDEFVVSRTFESVNVCTGEPHTVTLTFVVHEHEHRGNTVLTVKGSGETSDGYVGQSAETDVVKDGDFVIVHARWMTSNEETGGKYQVRHDITLDLQTGEVDEDLVVRCVRQPS
ncbi:MAG: hypothetical protein R3249_02030 [Nitriliruptorales bacterium]|nr:hypothetical protein [Nitriliruptorales bacterium]